MDDLNALQAPDDTWFERNRPPKRPQDAIHAERLESEIEIIEHEVEFIAQTINDVLRDPNLDVLRRAGERIAFATRRLKFEFQMLMDLHEQMKINHAMREGVARAEAEAAATAAAAAAAPAEGGEAAETAETETTDSSPQLTPSTSSSEDSDSGDSDAYAPSSLTVQTI